MMQHGPASRTATQAEFTLSRQFEVANQVRGDAVLSTSSINSTSESFKDFKENFLELIKTAKSSLNGTLENPGILSMAIEEALTNAGKHGLGKRPENTPGIVTASLSINCTGVIFQLHDTGVFPPDRLASMQKLWAVEDLNPASAAEFVEPELEAVTGRGLLMVRMYFTEMKRFDDGTFEFRRPFGVEQP